MYRVNQGDTEEPLALDKGLHSALIGVDGAHLKRLEVESSARVFLRSNETHGWVVLKGTAKVCLRSSVCVCRSARSRRNPGACGSKTDGEDGGTRSGRQRRK